MNPLSSASPRLCGSMACSLLRTFLLHRDDDGTDHRGSKQQADHFERQDIVGITVRAIGDKLMTDYVLPLEVIGLLLTAAMIGAVIIAMQEKRR